MDEFERDIKLSFLDEMNDLLCSLENCLEEVNDQIEAEQVNLIFRIIHTIKGNSFASGFSEIGKLIHKVESYLSSLRGHISQFNENYKTMLQQVYEELRYFVDTTESNLSANFNFQTLENIIQDFDPTFQSEQTNQVEETQSFEAQKEVTKKSLSVLIIEVNPDISELLSSIFQMGFNAEITVFRSAEMALQEMQKKRFDIITTDFKIGNMNGMEFITQIRRHNIQNHETPVLIIAAYTPDLNEPVFAFKNVYFLQKPFKPNRILYYTKVALSSGK